MKAKMSTREKQVADMVVRGASNKEISATLGITEKTVKFHTTSIYRIAGCKTRSQYIVKWYRENYVPKQKEGERDASSIEEAV